MQKDSASIKVGKRIPSQSNLTKVFLAATQPKTFPDLSATLTLQCFWYMILPFGFVYLMKWILVDISQYINHCLQK